MEGISSSLAFQNIYWRCIACFFDSSLRYNTGSHHVLFTNSEIPIVDSVDLAELFRTWKVEIVRLPITFRLPRESINAWGNQFYILDIIKYAAAKGGWNVLIVLDCDCVWTKTVEPISEAIAQEGCLTYTLNEEHYAWDASINGATRQEMASALLQWTADCGIEGKLTRNVPLIHYHGGEIFAATKSVCCELADLVDSLWGWMLKAGLNVDGIKEEAHFLSILYALRCYSNYTANAFLKRIWTTFHLNNAAESDFGLVVWHLPAEKRTGFRRLFKKLTRSPPDVWKRQSQSEYGRMLASVFGIPRRSATKAFLDISLKLMDGARRLL